MKKIKILVFLIFFCQFSVLANNLPQNIKENLGINQFLDENLKEILNQPLKENFALTPKGEYFFESDLSLFQKQCLENNATACAYLGGEFAADTRLSLDLNKALLLLQKACKLGRLDSCARINNIKFKLLKKLDEKTYQSNLKYFLDQNSSSALLEHIATLSKKDTKSAIILAKKSCEQGYDAICAGLSYMYACGQGVEKDLIKAKELSSKICEKDTKLCFAQGWVELFNKNDILAQKLFYKSCQAGYYADCNMAVDKNSKDQAMQLYLIKITQKNSQNQCQNSSNKQSFACHKASALSKEILKIQLKKISKKLLFTILI